MNVSNKGLFFLAIVFALVLSQLTGWLVNQNLAIGESIQVLPFVRFTHIRNMGGIFGIAQGKGWWFTGLAILVLTAIFVQILRSRELPRIEYFGFGLILGGGFSNILDRFIYGSVIDFIEVQGIPFWKYIFNTADTLIHVGIWPMVIYWVFFQKREESMED